MACRREGRNALSWLTLKHAWGSSPAQEAPSQGS
jgi:hypothetical protein